MQRTGDITIDPPNFPFNKNNGILIKTPENAIYFARYF